MRKEVCIHRQINCSEIEAFGATPLRPKLWWQRQDFTNFKEARRNVSKVYKDVAKKKGIPIGSDFPPEPSLIGDSRRGLGLGRARQRAKNTSEHLAAILSEQDKQDRLAAAATSPTGSSSVTAMFSRGRDLTTPKDNALRAVSIRFSEFDRLYAIEKAFKYYRSFLEEKAPKEKTGKAEPLVLPLPTAPPDQPDSDDSHSDEPLVGRSPQSEYTGIRRNASFFIDAIDDETDSLYGSEQCQHPKVKYLKGFGLSGNELKEAGLSASGRDLPEELLDSDAEDYDLEGG